MKDTRNYGNKTLFNQWLVYEKSQLYKWRIQRIDEIKNNLADLYQVPSVIIDVNPVDITNKSNVDEHPVVVKLKESINTIDEQLADKKELYKDLTTYVESSRTNVKTIIKNLENDSAFDVSSYFDYVNNQQQKQQTKLDTYGGQFKKITKGRSYYL